MKCVNTALFLIALAVAAGCTPYHGKFMCEKSKDYGTCSDVAGAYRAALEEAPPKAIEPGKPYKETRREKKDSKDPKMTPTALNAQSSQDLFRTRQYQQLAELLEEPIVPLVKAPTAFRTLVLVYNTGDTLYMPRYIYWMGDKANFVLGDYLNPRESGGQMIYPNDKQKRVETASRGQ